MKCPEWIRFEGDGARIRCQKSVTHEVLHTARVKAVVPGRSDLVEVTLYWQTGPEKVR